MACETVFKRENELLDRGVDRQKGGEAKRIKASKTCYSRANGLTSFQVPKGQREQPNTLFRRRGKAPIKITSS